MKKAILGFAVASVAYATSTVASYASDWNYSYTFDGLVVSGSFVGTQVGNDINGYVTGVKDVSLSINGVSVPGDIYTATYNLSEGAWVNGAVVSFDAAQNNFLFGNSDYADGQYDLTKFFYMIPPSVYGGQAYATDGALTGNALGSPVGNWTLVDPPSPAPDGGTTATLCGMSLLALGWFRRKLA